MRGVISNETNSTMQIFGIDFTSAPSKKKPLMLAEGIYADHHLYLLTLNRLPTFEDFEITLNQKGPWVMALDFPFSLPEKYLMDTSLPGEWEQYIPLLCSEAPERFLQRIREYRTRQPQGQKYHFRATDKIVKSCSPMMIDYTPVGRMFYQGAIRLLKSGVSVLPFQPIHSDRITLEGYPALLARAALRAARYSGKTSYKSDTKNKQSSTHQQVRHQIVESIAGQHLKAALGFTVDLNALSEKLIQDPTGDSLDAVLCAIQAAWAYTQRDQHYGIPQTEIAREGWIINPFYHLN